MIQPPLRQMSIFIRLARNHHLDKNTPPSPSSHYIHPCIIEHSDLPIPPVVLVDGFLPDDARRIGVDGRRVLLFATTFETGFGEGDAGEIEGPGALGTEIVDGGIGGMEFQGWLIGSALTTTVEEEGGDEEEDGDDGPDDSADDRTG